jgi:hypothetical protein
MTNFDGSEANIHRTLTFSVDGAMDDDAASDALIRLGVGILRWPLSGDPTRRWLACCLRSDGVVELWRMPGPDSGREGIAGSPSAGSPVSRLGAAGLPYQAE